MFCRFITEENSVGSLLVWLFLSPMILIAISPIGSEGKMGVGGRRRQKLVGTTPFQSKGNAFYDIKRALKKGHFSSFVEMGRDPGLQNPLVARLLNSRQKVQRQD